MAVLTFKVCPEILFCFCIISQLPQLHGIERRATSKECLQLFQNVSRDSSNVFQPQNCRLHKFTTGSEQLSRCIARSPNQRLVFIGDSRIRQQFYHLYGLISGDHGPEQQLINETREKVVSKNLTDKNSGITLEFYWKPYLDTNLTGAYTTISNRQRNLSPGFVLTGLATWELREHDWGNDMAGFTSDYARSLQNIIPTLERLASETVVIWQLQDPVNPELAAFHKKRWTNVMLKTANDIAKRLLKETPIILWQSSQDIAWYFRASSYDGFHLGQKALFWDNQILLNFYCNTFLKKDQSYCCWDRQVTNKASLTEKLLRASIRQKSETEGRLSEKIDPWVYVTGWIVLSWCLLICTMKKRPIKYGCNWRFH